MTGSLNVIGTATTLLSYGGITILTDPNFLHRGQKAYLGKGMWSTRRTDDSGHGKLPVGGHEICP